MNPLETFRLIVAYLLPALLSLLFGAPPSAKNPHGRVSFSNTYLTFEGKLRNVTRYKVRRYLRRYLKNNNNNNNNNNYE